MRLRGGLCLPAMFEAMGAGLSNFVRLWSGVGGREGGSWMRFGAGVDASSDIASGNWEWCFVDIKIRDAFRYRLGSEFVVAIRVHYTDR